eukprot:1980931-Rhodomonas_salina.1
MTEQSSSKPSWQRRPASRPASARLRKQQPRHKLRSRRRRESGATPRLPPWTPRESSGTCWRRS